MWRCGKRIFLRITWCHFLCYFFATFFSSSVPAAAQLTLQPSKQTHKEMSKTVFRWQFVFAYLFSFRKKRKVVSEFNRSRLGTKFIADCLFCLPIDRPIDRSIGRQTNKRRRRRSQWRNSLSTWMVIFCVCAWRKIITRHLPLVPVVMIKPWLILSTTIRSIDLQFAS